MLGNDQFSVPIHVEITEDGVVTKAEIVDNARSVDPVYRAIAASARNAVLLASPLALPPGHYRGTLDLVFDLQPKRRAALAVRLVPLGQGRSRAMRNPVRLA